nr:immunoglobulin heavy chain junction region [Macaca mulatta]MOX61941.1 immunoglobulin heavy chain junction region [Macaca mulatta]MOX62625.1 immunoglobulin heavy chain junction region [Macaca mulatta]MOX63397.1 immunoglobulin heavy chain junction region [Macaca mulatta]
CARGSNVWVPDFDYW